MSEDFDSQGSDIQDQSFFALNQASLGSDQLRDIIDDLRKENSDLRRQFDQAISCQSQIQILHQKHQRQIEELREVKKERDDLASRLEIAMEGNRALKKQLDDDQRRGSAQSELSTVTKTAEIEKLRSQRNQDLQALEMELQSAQADRDRAATQHKLANGKLKRILVSAERHFRQSVTSVESLVDLLEHPEPALVTEVVPAPVPQVDTHGQKIHKIKSKLSAVSREKQELAIAYANLQKQVDALQSTGRQEILDLEGKIAQLKEDSALYGKYRVVKDSALISH
jgi:chromosome segregation ATPase